MSPGEWQLFELCQIAEWQLLLPNKYDCSDGEYSPRFNRGELN